MPKVCDNWLRIKLITTVEVAVAHCRSKPDAYTWLGVYNSNSNNSNNNTKFI